MTLILAPTDIVLNVARPFIGTREIGPNAGQIVEMFLKFVGLKKGDPWCAAAVSWIGHAGLGEKWPVVKTGGCAVLGEWAEQHGVLVKEPQVGDIVLYWHASLGRFAHTGLVEQLLTGPKPLQALEGNTNDDGSRDGWGYLRKTRAIGTRDRFIRWTEMLA